MPITNSQYTYDFFLNRMLQNIKVKHDEVDTREGSIAFDACSACANELVQAYDMANNYYNESNIETARREGKLQCCRDQGIDVSVFDAHAAIVMGEFNVQVEIGSRWNLDLYNYTVTEYLGKGIAPDPEYYQYAMQCETAGTGPNGYTGNITPIDGPPRGLTYAAIASIISLGENETSDNDIINYYYNFVAKRVSDGNKAQYEQWCSDYPGIGHYKVLPLYNGPNTVGISILDVNNEPASGELIQEVQEYFDPGSTGMGDGVALIGAIVTVSTAEEFTINVSAQVSLAEGAISAASVKPAIEAYLNSLAFVSDYVGYIALASVILNADGIANVTNVTINADTKDIQLGSNQIPALGQCNITVVGE